MIRLGAAAVLMVSAGMATGQSSMPDAQVEANVLKALASAPELSGAAIQTNTVYGTVTLSGTVSGEALRRRAETLAANADGVRKVVDELQLGTATPVAGQETAAPPAQAASGADGQPKMVLQSDGTYAPAQADDGSTQAATAGQAPTDGAASGQATNGQPEPGTAPASGAQRNDPEGDRALDQAMDQKAQPQGTATNPPQQANQQYPQQQPADSQYGPYARRPMYPPQQYPGYAPQQGYGYAQQQGSAAPWGGQRGGEQVTVPVGAMIRVRINRTLSSKFSQPGTRFDGTVVNDVVAGGAVAIPRGAAVQGTVVDAKASGALKGRGEMTIQLDQVTLAGKPYPLVTDAWSHYGGDKTIETVNRTAGFGAVGAVIGALAGGGVGAAVGGGVGAAAGLGSSAASGNGQVVIPAEGVVSFNLAQPAQVTTVSEAEMQRLAYGVPAGSDPRYARRPGYYYGPRVVVGPGYYPGYGPYGYPPY